MSGNRRDGRRTVLVVVTMSLLVAMLGGGATYAAFTDTGSVNVSFEVGELPETPDNEEKPAADGSSIDDPDNSSEEQIDSDQQDSGSDQEETTKQHSRHFW